MTEKTWIVVANASRARIFEAEHHNAPLNEVEGFVHERSRVKGSDISVARPGRDRSGLGSHSVSALAPATDPKEVEVERVARELGEVLREAHTRGAYTRLALAATPHFLGLLRDSLDEQVRKCLVACLDKDYTLMEPQELRSRLAPVFHTSSR